jgi:hypothetical protein
VGVIEAVLPMLVSSVVVVLAVGSVLVGLVAQPRGIRPRLPKGLPRLAARGRHWGDHPVHTLAYMTGLGPTTYVFESDGWFTGRPLPEPRKERRARA